MHREDGMTRHHMIAKNVGGTFDKNNILPLHEIPHRAWHVLFDNDLPLEVVRGFTETVRPTLNREVYEMINGVLVKVEGLVESYNPRCFYNDRLTHYIDNANKRRR